MGDFLIGYISTTEIPADLAIKLAPGGQKRVDLIGKAFYDNCDY